MKVVFSSAADRDLEDIRRYTLEVAPQNVIQYVDAIVDSCETIAAAPLRFPIVQFQWRRGLRRRRHAPYLIFYVLKADEVEIVRILHERMDYMQKIVFDDPNTTST